VSLAAAVEAVCVPWSSLSGADLNRQVATATHHQTEDE
jgi:hypothetical protein